MMSGAEQLKDWMRRRGLNQEETAVHFGVQNSFISQLVNGKRTPGLANAIAIERETGIPVEAWLSSEVHEPGSATSAELDNVPVHKA